MSRKQGANPRQFDEFLPAHWKNPEAQERADAWGMKIFRNSLYTVAVRPLEGGALHLSIKRNDRKVIRDWRHLQRIKNEIVGPEREAFEVYPPESALVDEANQFHLWVLPEGERCPYGFDERLVSSPEAAKAIGAEQRPFEVEPDDLDATLDSEHRSELMRMRSK